MPSRFIVPQFIEEESKILGKLSVRQFVIIMVTWVFLAIMFRVAPLGMFFFLLFFIGVPAHIIALAKVNGQHFHLFLLNIITDIKKPNKRVWSKNITLESLRFEMERRKITAGKKPEVIPEKEKLSSSRLAELSLVVDTGGAYKGEKDQ